MHVAHFATTVIGLVLAIFPCHLGILDPVLCFADNSLLFSCSICPKALEVSSVQFLVEGSTCVSAACGI
jgi:hypothetical protein